MMHYISPPQKETGFYMSYSVYRSTTSCITILQTACNNQWNILCSHEFATFVIYNVEIPMLMTYHTLVQGKF